MCSSRNLNIALRKLICPWGNDRVMDKVQEISVVLVTVAFVGISCTRYPRTSKKYNKYKSNKKRGSYHSASQLCKKAKIMMLVKPKMLMKLMMLLMMVVMAMISMIRLTSRSEGKDTQVSPDPSPLTPCHWLPSTVLKRQIWVNFTLILMYLSAFFWMLGHVLNCSWVPEMRNISNWADTLTSKGG